MNTRNEAASSDKGIAQATKQTRLESLLFKGASLKRSFMPIKFPEALGE